MSKDQENTCTIIINNSQSKIEHLPRPAGAILAQELQVASPNYWFSQKFKNGMWDGKIKFFVRPANTFPTGLLPQVVTLLEENEVSFKIDDRRSNVNEYKLQPVSEDYKVTAAKESRGYQVDTINKVITNEVSGIPFMRGIINIATNGGKTTIAEGIIKELYSKLIKSNKKFLFVTHSKEIAYQAKKSIETDLGIKVGIIGDSQWEEENVCVTIVTTLYRRRNTPEFKQLIKDTIGFVADECHHSSSNSWYEVFNSLTEASIRLGLTGTVDKSNPVNEMKLYSCTGSIINKISNEYLIENGFSAKPACILFTVNTPELENVPYQDAYQLGIIESEERTQDIVDICEKETSNGNTVLILVERLEHGQILQEELEKLGKRIFFTNGTLDSERRQGLLEGLKNNQIDVLISTAILDEGVDVSNINAVIYARGMKSTRKLLQGLGRGLRKKADGSRLRFYDFIDDMHSSLLKHSLNRYEVLKAENFEIKMLEITDYKEMTMEEIEQ